MDVPPPSRPHMPGYGVLAADEGGGLLDWAWALERLTASHDYWLATVRPDHRPHLMPVWGAWIDGALWFSSGLRSRKATNLAHDPRCTLTTDNAFEPVILEGRATRITDLDRIATYAAAIDAKYATSYGSEFYDPDVNGCYRVEPDTVFALDEADFTGSPTRWTFPSR